MSRKILLPPLLVDGEPKILHKMTLIEVQKALSQALKSALGDSVIKFSGHRRPDWWPDQLDWDKTYYKQIQTTYISAQERQLYMCHLLTLCYRFYNQEETLHLFDVRPGEKPFWSIEQKGDIWHLYGLESGRQLWEFRKRYQVLPLMALMAQQEQERLNLSHKEQQPGTPSKRTRAQCIDDETEVPQQVKAYRRRSCSIMEGFCPSLRAIERKAADKNIAMYQVEPKPVFTCTKCSKPEETSSALIKHMTRCTAVTRKQAEQNSFLLNFNLLSKKSASSIETALGGQISVLDRKCKNELTSKRLAQLPFSSELGGVLVRGNAGVKDKPAVAKAFEKQVNTATSPRQASSYPVVYRPIRNIQFTEYKLTNVERRLASAEYRQKHKEIKRLKKQCKPCHVRLHSLSQAEIELYTQKPVTVFGNRVERKKVHDEKDQECQCSICLGNEVPSTSKMVNNVNGSPSKSPNVSLPSSYLSPPPSSPGSSATSSPKKISLTPADKRVPAATKRASLADLTPTSPQAQLAIETKSFQDFWKEPKQEPVDLQLQEPLCLPVAVDDQPDIKPSPAVLNGWQPAVVTVNVKPIGPVTSPMTRARSVTKIGNFVTFNTHSGMNATQLLNGWNPPVAPIPTKPITQVTSPTRRPRAPKFRPTPQEFVLESNFKFAGKTYGGRKCNGWRKSTKDPKPIPMVGIYNPKSRQTNTLWNSRGVMRRQKPFSCVRPFRYSDPTTAKRTSAIELMVRERPTVVLSKCDATPNVVPEQGCVPDPKFIYASTLLKCHLCGFEQLYRENSWSQIELHCSLKHPVTTPVYRQHRKKFGQYYLMVVEVFPSVDLVPKDEPPASPPAVLCQSPIRTEPEPVTRNPTPLPINDENADDTVPEFVPTIFRGKSEPDS